MSAVEACLRGVDPAIRQILERCLEGRELSVEDAVTLDGARGIALHALCLVADVLRRQQRGDRVTYVVNRNINFTNVCVKNCKFCAFSRELRSEQGYRLDTEEIVRRALQAKAYGATEVCLQAGLLPQARGRSYVEICRAVHQAAPDLHLHAFSPEEVKYGASLCRVPIREFLLELKDAGLRTMPGTSAEILDDRIRARISPGRITTRQWIEVVTTAHSLGISTSSTMMFGHVETAEDRARHMALLRSIQKDTGGFTEFVPLSFVHEEAPLFLGSRAGVAPGPSGGDVIRLHAIARLMLGATVKNLQVSWVKEGLRATEWLLFCGVNDLGGTLMNESISTAAGAQHGQMATPAAFRRTIRSAGRTPAQRTTSYEIVREYPRELEGSEPPEPLDQVDDPDATFGTYRALLDDPRFRYDWEHEKRMLTVVR
ncbi:MAG: 5-amino-6-(D-ribitylamino)uracil--L-tyrosine 4-hydroxyphenyl transferase CofH [Myxococcota bacterium]